LSPDKRIYYLILLDKTPYLLVGINPNPSINTVNISSFSRVAIEARGKAADCLRNLIENELVPLCQKEGREAIVTMTTTERGLKVIKNIKENLPKGIERITLNDKRGAGWSYIMELKK
jgi:hypothetical protein